MVVLAACSSAQPTTAIEPLGFTCAAEPALLAPKGGTRMRPRFLVDEDGVAIPEGVGDMDTLQSCRAWIRLDNGVLGCSGLPLTPACDQAAPAHLFHVEEQRVPVGDGLEAVVYVGADGSQVPSLAFYDVDRRVAVNLQVPGGPQEPRAVSLLPAETLVSWRSDPACGADSDLLFSIDGCRLHDETTHVRFVGRTFSTVPEDVTGYSCLVIEGTVIKSSKELHALRGTEVPLDVWRKATPVLAGTGRFRYRAWQVGCAIVPDATRQLFDTKLGGVRCSTQPAGDVERCVPNGDEASIGYADDGCTQPRVVLYVERAKPLFQSHLGTLHEVGAELPSVPLFDKSGEGSCRPQIPASWRQYELGKVVPMDTFGTLRFEAR